VLLKSSFDVCRPANIGSTIIFVLASQHINKTEHFISCLTALNQGSAPHVSFSYKRFLPC
jgi:hypothetical protein